MIYTFLCQISVILKSNFTRNEILETANTVIVKITERTDPLPISLPPPLGFKKYRARWGNFSCSNHHEFPFLLFSNQAFDGLLKVANSSWNLLPPSLIHGKLFDDANENKMVQTFDLIHCTSSATMGVFGAKNYCLVSSITFYSLHPFLFLLSICSSVNKGKHCYKVRFICFCFISPNEPRTNFFWSWRNLCNGRTYALHIATTVDASTLCNVCLRNYRNRSCLFL